MSRIWYPYMNSDDDDRPKDRPYAPPPMPSGQPPLTPEEQERRRQWEEERQKEWEDEQRRQHPRRGGVIIRPDGTSDDL